MQLWLLWQGVFTSNAKYEDSDTDGDNINRIQLHIPLEC